MCARTTFFKLFNHRVPCFTIRAFTRPIKMDSDTILARICGFFLGHNIYTTLDFLIFVLYYTILYFKINFNKNTPHANPLPQGERELDLGFIPLSPKGERELDLGFIPLSPKGERELDLGFIPLSPLAGRGLG